MKLIVFLYALLIHASLMAKISLSLLSFESYSDFYQTTLRSGIHDLSDSGYNQIDAAAGMRSELNDLLPLGIQTPGHNILGVFDNESRIGFVWYAMENQQAWLYFLGIDSAYQGKGFASKALTALESLLIQQKITALSLNVFASNARVFSFYKKCGFAILESFYFPDSDIIWRYEMKKKINLS